MNHLKNKTKCRMQLILNKDLRHPKLQIKRMMKILTDLKMISSTLKEVDIYQYKMVLMMMRKRRKRRTRRKRRNLKNNRINLQVLWVVLWVKENESLNRFLVQRS